LVLVFARAVDFIEAISFKLFSIIVSFKLALSFLIELKAFK
jgi:hypothetical protein